MEIRILHRQGYSVRAIARETGLSRNTVRRYLAGKQAGQYGPRGPRASKLAPHVPYILKRIESAKPARLTAVALLRELEERGYQGEVSLLQKYLRQIRGRTEPEPLVRFETGPGEQMQFDWAIFRRGLHPLVAFVATLGYSRVGFLRFADNARIETLLSDLVSALEYFGGVPREVL